MYGKTALRVKLNAPVHRHNPAPPGSDECNPGSVSAWNPSLYGLWKLELPSWEKVLKREAIGGDKGYLPVSTSGYIRLVVV